MKASWIRKYFFLLALKIKQHRFSNVVTQYCFLLAVKHSNNLQEIVFSTNSKTIKQQHTFVPLTLLENINHCCYKIYLIYF